LLISHFKPSKAAGPGGIGIMALMHPRLVVDKFVTSILKIVENRQQILPYQKYHVNKTANQKIKSTTI
jgi:hypothetical protein